MPVYDKPFGNGKSAKQSQNPIMPVHVHGSPKECFPGLVNFLTVSPSAYLEHSRNLGSILLASPVYHSTLRSGRIQGLSRYTVSSHLAENTNVCFYSLLDDRWTGWQGGPEFCQNTGIDEKSHALCSLRPACIKVFSRNYLSITSILLCYTNIQNLYVTLPY